MALLEFKTARHDDDIYDNFTRLVKDCQPATIDLYIKVFFRLYRKSIKNIKEIGVVDTSSPDYYVYVLDDIVSKIEHDRKHNDIKYSTIRSYKASLLCALSFCAAAKKASLELTKFSKKYQEEFHALGSKVSEQFLIDLYQRVFAWQRESKGVCTQKDNEAHAKAQTSSGKEKGFPDFLLERLKKIKSGSRFSQIVRLFVRVNIRYGLRPIEWKTAKLLRAEEVPDMEMNDVVLTLIENDVIATADTESPYYWLQVKNAKATHARACGEYRYICIGSDEKNLAELNRVLTVIQNNAENLSDEEFDKKRLRPMQRALREMLIRDKESHDFIIARYRKATWEHNRRLKKSRKEGKKNRNMPAPPIITVPTLYSTRHQAIANAKAEGMDVITTAALFGHISTISANKHYAHKKRGKSGRYECLPHINNLNIVVDNLRPELLQAICKNRNIELSVSNEKSQGYSMGM